MLETVRVKNIEFGEGAYRVAAVTGLLTGVAAGSDTAGHLWACRFTSLAENRSQTMALIQRVRARWITVAGFTAAQEAGLALFKLTGYSVAHTGGNGVTPVEKKEVFPASRMTARIADTGALTAGTQTLSSAIARDGYAELAAAATVQKGHFGLSVSTDDLTEYPFLLSNNEGLLLRSEIAMGAGGTARVVVEMDWLEIERYT